jgi:branched-chain amino acid transport system substrate-binding protein
VRKAAVLPLALAAVAAAACSREVRVAAIVSTTGAASTYGEKVASGIELARLELDSEAGWFGRRFVVYFDDDRTLPSRGVEVLRERIDRDGVRLVIGAVTSPVSLALAETCESRGVVLVSPSASAPELSEAGEFVFRVAPSDTLEGNSMAEFARDLGLSQVAVVAVAGAYGDGLRATFVRRFEGPRRRIVAVVSFAELDAAVLDAMASEVVASRPDGIYLGAYEADAAAIARRLREAGFRGVILGSSALGPVFAERAGSAAELTVFPKYEFDPRSTDPATLGFVERYRAAYGATPGPEAAQGYDAMKVLARAVHDAKSADPDAVRLALTAIRDYSGATGRIAFDRNGDVQRYPRLYVIRRGVPVPYETFVEQGGSIQGSLP